jgi:hypothetical protein
LVYELELESMVKEAKALITYEDHAGAVELKKSLIGRLKE